MGGLFSSRRVLGVFLLLCVTCIWVASSNIIQLIFTDLHFDKPFFLTHLNTSLFSLYLLGFLLVPAWRTIPWTGPRAHRLMAPRLDPIVDLLELWWRGMEPFPSADRLLQAWRASSVARGTHGLMAAAETETDQPESRLEDALGQGKSKKEMYPLLRVALMSALFCPFWFFANYTFNVALSMTSVTSNTILSTTSGMMTLFVGSVVCIERFSLVKLLAVAGAFVGVVLITLADAQGAEGTETLSGDLLSLLSALAYATYSVLLKAMLHDEERLHVPMFLGFLGFLNFFLLSPVEWLFAVVGIEPFAWPPALAWLALVCNGLLGTVLSDLLWLYSVVLTTPVVATVGLSLTAVLALLVDFFFKHKLFTGSYLLGMVLVVLNFVVVNTDDHITRFLTRRLACGPWWFCIHPYLKPPPPP